MVHRLPLLAAVFATLVSLAACGGGYEGTPSPIDTSSQSLKVASGPALSLMPTELRQLEVSGGTRPYTVSSGNSAVVLASVSDGTLRLAAVKGDPLPVNVVVTDAKSTQTTVSVTVTNSPQQGPIFTITPREVAIQPGATRTLELTGGTAPFSATSLSPNIATVTVSGNILTITGNAEGTNAEIRVFDSRNVTQSALVTVAAPIPSPSGQPLAVNWPALPSVLSLRPNNGTTYTIAGGSPPYSVTSTNTAVISGLVRNAALILRTGTAGNASMTVTDAVGNTVSRQMYVQTTSAPLALYQTSVTGIQYTTADIGIGGGMPPYTIVTTNPSLIANGTLFNGDVLRVNMQNVGGPATLTVKDSEGSTASVAIFVAAVLSDLSISPSAMTISELLRTSIPLRIIGGKAPYQVFSSFPKVLNPYFDGYNTIVVWPAASICVDQNTPVIITVIDATGAAASTTITVQDNGPC